VLFGIGTDYILFLLFRYRERLRAGDEPKQALAMAVTRVGEVIASAAGAVVIAFGALVLAVFGGFKSLGPALAIAVIVMALAAITLVPAIVSLIGTRVFWPSKSWQRMPSGNMFQRLGAFTGRRPAVVAVVSGGVMVTLALGALGFKTDYDQFSQLPKNTESAQGLADLQRGFPVGALNPTTVYVKSDSGTRLDPAALEQYAKQLTAVPGIGGAMPAPTSPTGSPVQFNADGTAAQINLLLDNGAYSKAALTLTGDGGALRKVAHQAAPAGSTALVGGVSSTFADISAANSRDLRVIFPVAGLLIAAILALMLRSLVAPIYLMIAVVLSFFATLGATVLAFQGIGGQGWHLLPAADHPVPLRGRDRHRLQHPDDRPATGRGARGQRPAPGCRPRGRARRSVGRRGRPHPCRHLRRTHACRAGVPHPDGLRRVHRHHHLGLRDVDVPGAQRHRVARPHGLVARAR
jgi:RND superfamily putative drug exporter